MVNVFGCRSEVGGKAANKSRGALKENVRA